MRNVPIVFLAAVLAASSPGLVTAQPTPSAQAVKAAADATRAAQKITLETRNGSGVSGSVGLYVIGRSRTRVVVRLPATGKYRVALHPGSDCSNNRSALAADLALAPPGLSTTQASVSSTIVALPIDKIRQGYVVDVRDATNAAALDAACARLNR